MTNKPRENFLGKVQKHAERKRIIWHAQGFHRQLTGLEVCLQTYLCRHAEEPHAKGRFKRLHAFASSQSKETCAPIEIYLVYGRHQFLSVPGTHVYGRIADVLLPPHRPRCLLGHKRPGISGALRGYFTEPAQMERPFDGHNSMVPHVSRICNGFL